MASTREPLPRTPMTCHADSIQQLNLTPSSLNQCSIDKIKQAVLTKNMTHYIKPCIEVGSKNILLCKK